MDFEFADLDFNTLPKIKVIGVGGAGGNAVNNMVASQLSGVTFIVANTDVQDLKKSLAEHKLQIGCKLTKGLGAGGDPKIGCDAAQESRDEIQDIIGEADMVFVTAGMGGGTGTGAAPVIAQIAREMGALTVGVVTKPFGFEGRRRMASAEAGANALKKNVDSLITIPNSRLVQLAPKNATFKDMLKKADDVLYHAVKGISTLLTESGLFNLDFADVKSVMGENGLALMGTGIASGENRAREAAMQAITSPLLEDVSIDGARGVLINITAGPDLTIEEVDEAANIIKDAAHEDAHIFFGSVFKDDADSRELSITVIATGIDNGLSASPGEQAGFPVRGGGAGGDRRPIFTANPPRVPTPAEEILDERNGKPAARPPRLSPGGNTATPTILRWSDPGLRGSGKPAQTVMHNPGGEMFTFDDYETEIPSFIRKMAD